MHHYWTIANDFSRLGRMAGEQLPYVRRLNARPRFAFDDD